MYLEVKRGEVYYANLSPVVGSEQDGKRPVVIVQNDIGNKHSPTTICAAITSNLCKNKLPTHIELNSDNISKDSVILLEQLRTIDKKRLLEKICSLDDELMNKINKALYISLGLKNN
jgi:mRNA interferase MazF